MLTLHTITLIDGHREDETQPKSDLVIASCWFRFEMQYKKVATKTKQLIIHCSKSLGIYTHTQASKESGAVIPVPHK